MIVVVHYEGNRDPDVYFGLDEKAEKNVLRAVGGKDWDITRSSKDSWYGQDLPNYAIHHYEARRKKSNAKQKRN